jgi:hypothetical protein
LAAWVLLRGFCCVGWLRGLAAWVWHETAYVGLLPKSSATQQGSLATAAGWNSMAAKNEEIETPEELQLGIA